MLPSRTVKPSLCASPSEATMMFKVEQRGQEVTVSGNCVFTGEYYAVTVPSEQYKKWNEGMLAQNAFPNLSADDREFLISGIAREGWGQHFGHGESQPLAA